MFGRIGEMNSEKCKNWSLMWNFERDAESFATGRLESLPYRCGWRGKSRNWRIRDEKAWYLEEGPKLNCSAFAAFCRDFSRYMSSGGGSWFWRHRKDGWRVLSRLVPVCPRRKWLISRGGVFLSHVASGWCPALSQRKWLISRESVFFGIFVMGRMGRMQGPVRPALARCLGSSGASPSHLGKPEFCLKGAAGCGRLIGPGPMECGLTNPARAGMQQRQFAPHPPWSPWHSNFECGARSAEWKTADQRPIPHFALRVPH